MRVQPGATYNPRPLTFKGQEPACRPLPEPRPNADSLDLSGTAGISFFNLSDGARRILATAFDLTDYADDISAEEQLKNLTPVQRELLESDIFKPLLDGKSAKEKMDMLRHILNEAAQKRLLESRPELASELEISGDSSSLVSSSEKPVSGWRRFFRRASQGVVLEQEEANDLAVLSNSPLKQAERLKAVMNQFPIATDFEKLLSQLVQVRILNAEASPEVIQALAQMPKNQNFVMLVQDIVDALGFLEPQAPLFQSTDEQALVQRVFDKIHDRHARHKILVKGYDQDDFESVMRGAFLSELLACCITAGGDVCRSAIAGWAQQKFEKYPLVCEPFAKIVILETQQGRSNSVQAQAAQSMLLRAMKRDAASIVEQQQKAKRQGDDYRFTDRDHERSHQEYLQKITMQEQAVKTLVIFREAGISPAPALLAAFLLRMTTVRTNHPNRILPSRYDINAAFSEAGVERQFVQAMIEKQEHPSFLVDVLRQWQGRDADQLVSQAQEQLRKVICYLSKPSDVVGVLQYCVEYDHAEKHTPLYEQLTMRILSQLSIEQLRELLSQMDREIPNTLNDLRNQITVKITNDPSYQPESKRRR